MASFVAVLVGFAGGPAVAGDSLGTAMKCAYIAALSYADQYTESASTIAKTAIRSCRTQVNSAAKDRWLAEKRKGSSLPLSDAQRLMNEYLTESAEAFVIDMRSQAKGRGPDFYRDAAERISKRR